MAFNPIANKFKQNVNIQKSDTVQSKTPTKIENNSKDPTFGINHKSNIFKILKTNQKLTQEDCINLTELIFKYIKNYY